MFFPLRWQTVIDLLLRSGHGHNLCLHFGADEQPCTTYFDVHQGYRVLTRSQVYLNISLKSDPGPSQPAVSSRIILNAVLTEDVEGGSVEVWSKVIVVVHLGGT